MLKIGRPAEYAPVPVHLANFVAPIPIGMPVISPGDVFSNSMIDPVSSMAFPSTLNIPIPLSATRCLVLENMLTPEDILNEEEYEDILLDIEEECSQFGKVLKVAVPKDPQDKGFGKAYVLFDDIEGCKTAKSKLHGRLFNMRQVSGKFYDENKFHSADYM